MSYIDNFWSEAICNAYITGTILNFKGSLNAICLKWFHLHPPNIPSGEGR